MVLPPQAAALAATLLMPGGTGRVSLASVPPTPIPPARANPPAAKTPVATPPSSQALRGAPSGTFGPLFDAPGRPGYRTDAAGCLYHMGWYSGEYATPPGWTPPAGSPTIWPSGPLRPPIMGTPTLPTPRGGTRSLSALCIPVARQIVGASSPFASAPSQPCDFCNRQGHQAYECPQRFAELYGIMPGFLASGDLDPTAWHNGDLVPTARAALAAYLHTHSVPQHRKYHITLAHIASGTAPLI